jgi:hypothetical protein
MLYVLFHHSPESLVDSFTCFVEHILKLTLTPEILDYSSLKETDDAKILTKENLRLIR